jgi:ABC-type transport system involved in Fe-S cluster assembly fused permease/ATPase subunit
MSAGKSTIGGLMLRFYDPALGAVLLDGIDIKDVDPHWLRGHLIGYIGQVCVGCRKWPPFHSHFVANIQIGLVSFGTFFVVVLF